MNKMKNVSKNKKNGFKIFFGILVMCLVVSTVFSLKEVDASNKKKVTVNEMQLERMNDFKMNVSRAKISLYYNKKTKCIYTNEITPIADQVFNVKKGICEGPYQKYIQ